MKTTIIMIFAVIIFPIAWITTSALLGSIGYIFSSYSFIECLRSIPSIMIGLFLAIFITSVATIDIYNKISKETQ